MYYDFDGDRRLPVRLKRADVVVHGVAHAQEVLRQSTSLRLAHEVRRTVNSVTLLQARLLYYMADLDMPYVPGCAHDIFISYASENNRDNWVEQFAEALGRELGELLGVRYFDSKDSVFLDRRRLEACQSFPEEISAAAKSSAIFIPVLSPGYMLSTWCNRERTSFFSVLPYGATAPQCLAPIVIRPFDETSLDSLTRNAQRLSFLSADEQTPLPPGSAEWTTQVRRFAGQLKTALQKLRRGCRPVFLGRASETDRLQNLRPWCHAELERRHFRTIPEFLPALEDGELVRASLEEAGLAIHFLGGTCEAALEAIETSICVCQGPTIVYQPFGASLTAEERLWLIDFEAHLPSTPLQYQRLTGKNDQELLEVIDDQLTSFNQLVESIELPPDLALVCEEPDLDDVRELKAEIRARRIMDVSSPDFLIGRLRSMERLRRWQDYMNRSNALLFYQGASQRERLQLMWETAQQNRKDVRCRWFVAPPDLDSKRQIDPQALWNIDQILSFVDNVAQPQRV
jgi:hypothetical protein